MRKHYPLNSNGAEDAGQMPWKDGVPSTGTEGSYPGQALFTDSEAEILAAIDASGQSRNGSDLAQLVQAIARGIYLGQIGGSANALAAAIPNNVVFSALLPGTRFAGFVTATNTGGVTFAISGIGPVATPDTVQAALLSRGGGALQAGDLPVNQLFEIRWDGSAFKLTAPAPSETKATIVQTTAATPVVGIEANGSNVVLPHNVATDITQYNTVTNNMATSTFAGGVFTVGTGEDGTFDLHLLYRFPDSQASLNTFARLLRNGGQTVAFAQSFTPGVDTSGGGDFSTSIKLAAGDTIKANVVQQNTNSQTRNLSIAYLKIMRRGG